MTETDTPDRPLSAYSLWFGLIVAGWIADFLYPLPFVPGHIPSVPTGGIFILLGFGLVALALHEFRDADTRLETGFSIPILVTRGVFRHSRNPIYLGLHVALLGCAVAIDSLWVLAMLAPFHVVVANTVIPREEAELERTFGELYLDYKSDVRRWL